MERVSSATTATAGSRRFLPFAARGATGPEEWRKSRSLLNTFTRKTMVRQRRIMLVSLGIHAVTMTCTARSRESPGGTGMGTPPIRVPCRDRIACRCSHAFRHRRVRHRPAPRPLPWPEAAARAGWAALVGGAAHASLRVQQQRLNTARAAHARPSPCVSCVLPA